MIYYRVNVVLCFFPSAFKDDNRDSWLKREKSMADWDDECVAEAAAKIEAEKQAQERAKIEAERKLKEEKEKKKVDKKKKSEETPESENTQKE